MVLSEALDDQVLSSRFYIYLGVIALDVFDFKRAKEYLDISDKKIPIRPQQYEDIFKTSMIYAEGMMNNPENGSRKLRNYIEKHSSTMSLTRFFLSQKYLGMLYRALEKNELAIQVFENLIEYIDFNKNILIKNHRITILVMLSRLNYNVGNYKKALELGEEASEELRGNENKTLFEKSVWVRIKSLIALNRQDEAFEVAKSEFDRREGLLNHINRRFSNIMDSYVNNIFHQREFFNIERELELVKDDMVRLEIQSDEFEIGLDKFQLLQDYFSGVSRLQNLEDVYSFSTQFLSEIINFDVFFIGYVDELNAFINFRYLKSSDGTKKEFAVPITDHSLSSYVVREGKKVVVTSSNELSPEIKSLFKRNNISQQESAILIPLEDEDGIFGLTSIQSAETDFYTEMDIEFFESFVSIFGGLVHLIKMKSDLDAQISKNNKLKSEIESRSLEFENLVNFDELTGFYSKEGFRKKVEEIIFSFQGPSDITLFVIFISNCRAFQERYGHIMCNQYLLDISRLIKIIFSDKDVVLYRDRSEFLIAAEGNRKEDILNDIREFYEKMASYEEEFNFFVNLEIFVKGNVSLVYTFEEVKDIIYELRESIINGQNKRSVSLNGTGRDRVSSLEEKGGQF